VGYPKPLKFEKNMVGRGENRPLLASVEYLASNPHDHLTAVGINQDSAYGNIRVGNWLDRRPRTPRDEK
jgi:hypothetical protein